MLRAQSQSTVHASIVRAALAGAAELGMDAGAVLGRAGLTRAAIDDPDARLTYAENLAFWKTLFAPPIPLDLGLRLGAVHRRVTLGVVGHAARQAPNVKAALGVMDRFRRIVHDNVIARFEFGPNVVLHHLAHPEFVRIPQALDVVLSGHLEFLRALTGTELRPLEVWLQHRPEDLEPYRTYFRCPVERGREESRLVLDGAVAELPVARADPELGAYLERHAEAVLRSLPVADDLTFRVRSLLTGSLRGDAAPSQSAVARRLAMSERTFQRRLREAGTSFVEVLAEVRRELAHAYLSEGMASGEVAFLLGYSEQSAFHRAFRRWSGQTPEAFRQDARRRASSPGTDSRSTAHLGEAGRGPPEPSPSR